MRIIVLLIFTGAIVGTIFYLEMKKPRRDVTGGPSAILPTASLMSQNAEKEKKYERAKEISTPDGYLNTPSMDSTGSPQANLGNNLPITIGEFIGKKVVLLDIWTYSCINCQRTIPYLNAWYEKYKNAGLVIIGLHTPEFEFEKKYENVLAAVQKFGIQYPVVMDNDYSTWIAYGNRYWPRKYLIDIDGYIAYDHIGEGGYAETENKIQAALEERMARIGEMRKLTKDVAQPSGVVYVVPEAALSPETYFGSARNTLLGNGKSGVVGVQKLSEPKDIKPNTLYLAGDWDMQDEFAQNKSAGAKIIFRYQAKNAYMVVSVSQPVSAQIFQDGKPVKTVEFTGDGLYALIEDDMYGKHTLEVRIAEPHLRVFTFTFG